MPPRTLILAIHLASLRNRLHEAWSNNPRQTVLLTIAAALLLATQAAGITNDLAQCTACQTSANASLLTTAGVIAAFAFLAGTTAGLAAAGRLNATASSPWLAILPLSQTARQSACRYAAAAYALAASCALAAPAWLAAHAVHLPAPLLWAAGASLTYGTAFTAAARHRRRPAQTRAETTPPTNTRRFPLGWIDRPTPTHASRWAWSGSARLIATAWLMSLVPLGGASASVSLAQHQPFPAFAIALIGANLIFIAALRCRPLASPVFRASSLGFTRAVAAIIRAPLLLSAAWFTLVAAFPVAEGAWRALPLTAGALLLLNALYAATAIFRPDSPRQAMLLYASGLAAVAYETLTAGIAYGALTLAATCAVATLLLRRARRQFRATHAA
jgi:hypothetical protein